MVERLQVLYASACEIPDERGKGQVGRGFVSRYWDLKQSLRLQNNFESVKFKCQVWSEIAEKFSRSA